MTKWDDYIEARVDCNAAHFALLSSRESYITVQSHLRAATTEEATDQIAYLEERATTLAPLVDYRTRLVAALAAEVEQLRVRAVTDDLSTVLAALTVLVDMVEMFGTQMPRPADAFATAAMLTARAQQNALTLPKEEYRLRIASNELAMRVQAMQVLI